MRAVINPSLSGVAAVTPSATNELTGAIHRVNAPANERVTNALPASAGLNMLCPNPPNASLAIAMQNTAPTAIIHNGVRGGITRTNRIPVTMALPSMWNGWRRINLATYSVSTVHSTPTASMSRTYSPKKYTAPAQGNKSANVTMYMSLLIEAFPRR